MSEFTGYVCWDRRKVLSTIATEAVSPSDSVFLATHAPLDIRRVTVTGGDVQGEDVITERRLLDEFLRRAPNNGVLVVPVLGASGAGKSHLVRWVHVNLPAVDTRRVIYLPKESTSLAGVVDKLLLGLAGPQFDDIRRDVGRLGGDITQESLERRLLDELAEQLRVATPDRARPEERALVGERGLYVLLHDPFFRGVLLQEGSLVRRRAAHAISGRGPDETDVPLQFVEDDLPTDIRDIREAGASSKRLIGQIAANGQLRRAAVRLLNEHLDAAVMQAANLGVGRLQKAFLDIRRALAQRDQEIVLLVEDFALVQGIQRDLLDAILETGERGGRTVLAPIRTLLAVTTGYYEGLVETVRTRIESSCPFRYELKVTLDGSGADASDLEGRVIDFAGRYLNAARVGRDTLDRVGATDRQDVPNACDRCPVREPCHSGFGSAQTGHGLYPYNRPALLRAIRSTTPDDDVLNPRAVLARVVRHVLTEHVDDIRSKVFPNNGFAEAFPPRRDERILSATVSDQAARSPEGERRRVLLEFWGGAPAEFGNLAAEIHDAFAIPRVEGVVPAPAPPRPRATPLGDSTPTRTREAPESVRRRLREIDDWNGRDLAMSQGTANELRKIVHAAVTSRITWTDPAGRRPPEAKLDKAWPPNALTISIEDAKENRPKAVPPTIRFERSPRNARFFQDLVRWEHGAGTPSVGARARLDEIAERYAPVVQGIVLDHLGRSDEALLRALTASLGGAALSGITVPGDPVPALLSASLTADLPQRTDDNIRTVSWQQAQSKHGAARREFVTELRRSLGAAQGTGEVETIDAVRAVRLLTDVSTSWLCGGDRPDPEWAATAARPLAALVNIVDEQIEELGSLVSQIRACLPSGVRFSQTVEAVQTAINASEGHGFVRVRDVPALKERNAAAARAASSSDLERLESDLRRAHGASFPTRLAVAARDRGPGLGMMRDFLVENSDWLDAGLARADLDRDDAAADLVARVQRTVTCWRQIASGRS